MTEEKHNKYYWDTTRNINDKKVITKGSDYDLDKKLNRKEYPVYTGVMNNIILINPCTGTKVKVLII